MVIIVQMDDSMGARSEIKSVIYYKGDLHLQFKVV